MSKSSLKDEILEKLSLIQDEPEESNLLFGFDKFANQIADVILDKKTHTPFVIAIHGDWGSGKTSLILKIQTVVKDAITKNSLSDWHQVRFDAWEYERVDVIPALFHTIVKKYETKKTLMREFGKSVGVFLTDLALQKTFGMDLEKTKTHFQEFITEIPQVKTKLENLVSGGRLIIFIDDLDRCHVDNVLNMLEAIKMFLTAKNVIFVIAVDMNKIERAWKLRYNIDDSSIEGKEHVEKIFPLKLSMPPKEYVEIKKYVRKLCESLSDREQDIIVNGCPPNPRKIKRLINLIYFVLKSLDDNKDFDKKIPLVIIWCILTSVFPKLAKIIRTEPKSLIQMVVIVCRYSERQEIMRQRANFEQVLSQARNLAIPGITLNHLWTYPSTIIGLLHVIDEEQESLNLLLIIGKFYSMEKPADESSLDAFEKRVKSYYDKILEPLNDVIYHSSLIGN